MYFLRFSDGRGHTQEFQSSLPPGRDQVEAALQLFRRNVYGRRAMLEVHHRYRGWQPIYSANGEWIYIADGQTIDLNALTRSLAFTLAVLSQKPSLAEQRAKRLQFSSQLRAEQALIRRRQFKLVSSARSGR